MEQEYEFEFGGDEGARRTASFASGTGPNLNEDGYYDDVLVAYFEIGGQLNDLERQRLRYYGYDCDPAKKLEEMMEGAR